MRREQAKARTKRFQIGEEEIGAVQKFKYLGQITSGDDDDDDDLPASQRQFERWARVDLVVSIRVDVGLA
jgi:hypothetical protein